MTNREQFIALLEQHHLTHAQVVGLMCMQARRPIAVRTITYWVMPPERPAARDCPDWAVNALRDALEAKK